MHKNISLHKFISVQLIEKILKGFIYIFKITIFIATFPIILLIIYISNYNKNLNNDRLNVLILRLNFVKNIFLKQSNLLEKHNIITYYYAKRYTKNVNKKYFYKSLENPIIEIHNFIRMINNIKPKHVEFYYYFYSNKDILLSLYYIIYFKMKNIPIITILTGGEILYWKKHNIIKKFAIRMLLRNSKLVLYKELYMPKIISRNNLINKNIPIKFFPNATDVRNNIDYKRDKNIILYMNSFKKWRHPDLLVRAAKYIKKDIGNFKIIIAGYRNILEKKMITDMYENLENIELLPYDVKNTYLLNKAKIFILPSELIFCNNSLLEAMERGVPAIIPDIDPNGRKIVDDGLNGYIVKLNPKEFAKKIVYLLKNDDLRINMGIHAREKIIEEFNNEDRINRLYMYYKNYVW